MRDISFQNKKIAYQKKGKGTPLVLLHGFCEDQRMWEDFAPYLVDYFKVITIDLPGFGQSDVWKIISIDVMADAVNAVLKKEKIKKCVLIGHSMGGYVSLCFAERYAHKLMGMGLFHSHPYADEESKKENRTRSINFIEKYGHALFVKQLFPNLFEAKYARNNQHLLDIMTLRASQLQQKGIVEATKAMRDRTEKTAILRNVICPVLMIIGEQDTAVPSKSAEQMTSLAAVSDIHIFAEIGHMGMFSKRKETQRIVRNFTRFCANFVVKVEKMEVV